jgi:hypothetical protein
MLPLRHAAILFLVAGVCLSWIQATGAQQAAQPQPPPAVRFTDIRKAAGIAFMQDSTESNEKYYLETMGTGAAWLDYDQDGLMDLFLVQTGATDAYKPDHPLRSALYRNNGDGTFTDVTEKAGLQGAGYAMGAAAGDYDNDGFVDLYVAGVNANQLYHNNGDGTFTDVTNKAGAGGKIPGFGKPWSVTAGWVEPEDARSQSQFRGR